MSAIPSYKEEPFNYPEIKPEFSFPIFRKGSGPGLFCYTNYLV